MTLAVSQASAQHKVNEGNMDLEELLNDVSMSITVMLLHMRTFFQTLVMKTELPGTEACVEDFTSQRVEERARKTALIMQICHLENLDLKSTV